MQQHRALTERQRQFVIEYCVHGNAAEAARSAGYSVQVARQSAHKLLLKPHIASEIRRHSATMIDAHLPSAVATLAQLMNDCTVEPRDRIRAAEALLKHVRPANGASLAVQVNVGAQSDGAQAIIQEIWSDKLARETIPREKGIHGLVAAHSSMAAPSIQQPAPRFGSSSLLAAGVEE